MDIKKEVLGINDESIVYDSSQGIVKPIHNQVVQPFLALQKEAREAGFDIQIVSGYRSFERQLAIWTNKARGLRDLYGKDGERLDYHQLSKKELLFSILNWSSLPGGSRHHWGCDMDIYDASAVPSDYDVQLTDNEVLYGGPFEAMHNWIDEKIKTDSSHDFFRPYTKENYARKQGGVSPERWHLSYAPIAVMYQQAFEKQWLLDLLEHKQVDLFSEIKDNFDYIWNTYIWIDKETYPEKYYGEF